MTKSFFLSITFATLSVWLIGCAGEGPKLLPVSGSVVLTNGKTVTHGYVNFHPDAAKGNTSRHVGIGYIQNGTFTIKTGEKPGIVAGWYKVTVDAANETDPNNPYVTEWFAEQRYTDKEKSKLTVEVVEDPKPNQYDLKLNPAPKPRQRKKSS